MLVFARCCLELYFVGMPWLPTQKSGLLLGVGEAAQHIAARMNEVSQIRQLRQ